MSNSEDQLSARKAQGRWGQRLRALHPLLLISGLPLALTSPLWLQVWHGSRPRATNGSGHYAIAQLYDQTIFPDTFGWTHAYFGGMPFPNFYPPLFYWLVALVHHTHLFSFNAAFKLVMALPLLLMPAAIWLLAYFVARKRRTVANFTAAASLFLIFVPQFQLKIISGLDYFSTLVVGLYTQPLGFVLLLIWYAAYVGAHRSRPRFALTAVLLALTILANFFNAITAALFIAATLTNDTWRYARATDRARRTHARNAGLAHLAAPFVAACLTMFWLEPMLGESRYLVTRPFIVPLGELVTPALVGWYALAAAGLVIGLRRSGRALWPYCLACLALGSGIVCSGTLAPRWFPLQSYRFLATLDFLLAVPVGLTLTTCYRSLLRLRDKQNKRRGLAADSNGQTHVAHVKARRIAPSYVLTIAALLFIGVIMARTPARSTFTFYQQEANEQIDGVLGFAAQHRDGRYLIELAEPQLNYQEAGYDSRAISAYLGLQGDEALNGIFRESSPNVLFVNPQTNALSANADNHGISSVLADDQDFIAQPLATHLARARQLGVKYLVIATPMMKEKLRAEPEIAARYDMGAWSVFALRHDPPTPVSALKYRPALVVSDFSVKERRRDDYGFVRLAEEQFADNWFDVPLVRAPETKIDQLQDLDQFGALILDTYDCNDENLAYAKLHAYAQRHTFILLMSDAPLCQRIKHASADFPHAEIIERTTGGRGAWVEALAPSYRYNTSAIRQAWGAIRRVLEQHKVAVAPEAANAINGAFEQNHLTIKLAAPTTVRVPVLINTTFHPNWQRADGAPVYPATPFAMLTFVDRPTELTFARTARERFALAGSIIMLLAFCCFMAWPLIATGYALILGAFRPRFASKTTERKFIPARWTTRKYIGD